MRTDFTAVKTTFNLVQQCGDADCPGHLVQRFPQVEIFIYPRDGYQTYTWLVPYPPLSAEAIPLASLS